MRQGERHGSEQLEAACARALRIGNPTLKSVQAILKNGLDKTVLAEEAETKAVMHQPPLRQRQLRRCQPLHDGSATCPADGVKAQGTTCRAAAGACDAPEVCDGAGKSCPADVLRPASTLCHSASGACDASAFCSGSSPSCPTVAPLNCDDGNPCTADACDGHGGCTHAAAPAGTPCRGASGLCDVAEVCDGASTQCPADAKAPAGTLCRDSVDSCDPAETCTGSSSACPADVNECSEPITICDRFPWKCNF